MDDDNTCEKTPVKKVDLIFKLTEARWAFSNNRMEVAKKRYEEILEIDPNHCEAQDFLREFDPDTPMEKKIVSMDEFDPRMFWESEVKKEPAEKKEEEEPDGLRPDYSINEIFILTNEGILITNFSAGDSLVVDKDIMTGLLTAIQTWAKEVFTGQDPVIKHIGIADFELLISVGEKITVCALVTGNKPLKVGPQLKKFVAELEQEYTDTLLNWTGSTSDFKGMREMMMKLIFGGYVG